MRIKGARIKGTKQLGSFKRDINSYNNLKLFPNLPKSILDNNSLSPYHQFIDLPTANGIPKWTESAPVGWQQSAPYYNVFLKFYLKSNGGDETVPNGGQRIHALKAASFGSALGNHKAKNVTKNTIGTSNHANDWSLSTIRRTVNIPPSQTFVNFGCFYKVLSKDPLRPLNFGAIAIHFSRQGVASYVNYSVIHGGEVDLLGNSATYTYLNTYNSSKVRESYHQWLGQPIIRFRKLSQINQNSVFNRWQFLNHKVVIPTFQSSPSEGDIVDGKADSCTIMICFGENNSYLDDGSGLNTGAVQFLYPFLSLT